MAAGNAGRLERVSPTWSDKNGRAKRPHHVTKEKKRYQAVCGLQEEYHDVEKLELIILEHVDSDNKERMKEIHF